MKFDETLDFSEATLGLSFLNFLHRSFTFSSEVRLPGGLGDTSTDFTGRIRWSDTLTKKLSLGASAGFTYRTQGFSASIPWALALQSTHFRKWSFTLGARGLSSLNTDSTENLDKEPQVFDAINPSWIYSQLTVGYDWNDSVQIAANWFRGPASYVGLQLSWKMGSPHPGHRLNSSPHSQSAGTPIQSEVDATQEQLYLFRIPVGASDGVTIGQVFDVYSQAQKIARAKVTALKNRESVLNVLEYFQDQTIETGFQVQSLTR
jgi:hypothetical protein